MSLGEWGVYVRGQCYQIETNRDFCRESDFFPPRPWRLVFFLFSSFVFRKPDQKHYNTWSAKLDWLEWLDFYGFHFFSWLYFRATDIFWSILSNTTSSSDQWHLILMTFLFNVFWLLFDIVSISSSFFCFLFFVALCSEFPPYRKFRNILTAVLTGGQNTSTVVFYFWSQTIKGSSSSKKYHEEVKSHDRPVLRHVSCEKWPQKGLTCVLALYFPIF